MFHLLAGYANDVASGAVDTQVNVVADPTVTLSSGKFMLPTPKQVLWGWVGGTSLVRAKIDTPSYQNWALPYIDPVDGDGPGGDEPALYVPEESGIIIPGQEFAAVQVSRAVAAAADVFWALALGDRYPTPVKRPNMFTVYATGAVVTSGEGVWASGQLTFSRSLPDGIYEIMGMHALGTNLLLARLIFPAEVQRPGVIAVTGASQDIYRFFRYGNFGSFGRFRNTNPPQLEVLGTGVTTTQDVMFELVKVG